MQALESSSEGPQMFEILSLWPIVVGTSVLALCGYLQVTRNRVPNSLTYPALGVGLLASAAVQLGWLPGSGGIASSLLAGLLGFISLITFYSMGVLGAGCVKSNAAFGVWMGCYFAIVPAAKLVMLCSLVSALATTSAVWYWTKTKRNEEHFPAQLTIAAASIVTVFSSLLVR